MFKKTLLSAAIAAGSLMSLAPTAANAQYAVIVQTAPPPPLHEVAPPPRAGHVWAPGHHEWRGNRYVWVRGHWLAARSGYEYHEPRWIERNGQWQMLGGNWERRGPYGDRDRDGIANRYDPDSHHNRQPARRSGPYGDRDGDGVNNRNDRFPDNPRHS